MQTDVNFTLFFYACNVKIIQNESPWYFCPQLFSTRDGAAAKA